MSLWIVSKDRVDDGVMNALQEWEAAYKTPIEAFDAACRPQPKLVIVDRIDEHENMLGLFRFMHPDTLIITRADGLPSLSLSREGGAEHLVSFVRSNMPH